MQTLRILYIEDEPLNMRLIKKIVKPMGYELITAETGKMGIMLARGEKPDVILVDINLPDMDGFDVIHYLRQLPETEHTPAIAITADTHRVTLAQCLDAGFDAYLGKPISRSILLRTITQLSSQQKAAIK